MEFKNFEFVKFYELIKAMILQIKIILEYKFLEKNNNNQIIKIKLLYFIFF